MRAVILFLIGLLLSWLGVTAYEKTVQNTTPGGQLAPVIVPQTNEPIPITPLPPEPQDEPESGSESSANPIESVLPSMPEEVIKRIDKLDKTLTDYLASQSAPVDQPSVVAYDDSAIKAQLHNIELYAAELVRWKRGLEAESASPKSVVKPASDNTCVNGSCPTYYYRGY